jgi:hypothetical protein
VRSWRNSTVATDLIEIAMTTHPTTCSIWHGLKDQFVDHKETHTMIINAEFCTFIQGELFFLTTVVISKAWLMRLVTRVRLSSTVPSSWSCSTASLAGSPTWPLSSSGSSHFPPLRGSAMSCNSKRSKWMQGPAVLLQL